MIYMCVYKFIIYLSIYIYIYIYMIYMCVYKFIHIQVPGLGMPIFQKPGEFGKLVNPKP
jgi:hypothetical protein